MSTTVEIIVIEALVSSSVVATIGLVGVVVLVLGAVTLIAGLFKESPGFLIAGLLAVIAGVLFVAWAMGSDNREIKSLKIEAMQQQAHITNVVLDGSNYRGFIEGEMVFGCLAGVNDTQFILVPGGPNEDGECLVIVQEPATPPATP